MPPPSSSADATLLSCSAEGLESCACKEERICLFPWGKEGKRQHRFCGCAEKLGYSPKVSDQRLQENEAVSDQCLHNPRFLYPHSVPQALFMRMQVQAAVHEVCTSPQKPPSSRSPRHFSLEQSWLEEPCPMLKPLLCHRCPPGRLVGGGTAQQDSVRAGRETGVSEGSFTAEKCLGSSATGQSAGALREASLET